MAHVPAVLDEVDGQPVQQFRMGGPGALVSEITGGLYDAASEDHLPHAVHCDAGSERMIRAGDPLGEIEAGGAGVSSERRQDGGHAGSHFIARLVVGSADEDVGFAQPGLVIHHHHRGVAAVDVAFQHLDFRVDGLGCVFHPRGELRRRVRLEGFEFRDAILELLHPAIAERGFVIHHRRGTRVGGPFSGLRGGVEKGVHLEEFLLRDGVVFVVVALGALHRQAEDGGGDGIDLVHGVVHAVFLLDGSALVGVHAVAQETGGGDLVRRGVGDEVAGDLLQHELVVGLVLLESVDHPIAPRPHVAVVVDRVAVGVGVSRAVEPWQRQALGEMRGLHQAVDEFFPAVGRGVGEVGVDVLRGGRQTGEVEENAADEGGVIGGGSGLQLIGLEALVHEVIQRVRGGGLGFPRGYESPMRLIYRAVFDPFLQGGDLLRLERRHVRVRRRHHQIGILRHDPLHDLAAFRIARDNGCDAVPHGHRLLADVEAQLPAAMLRILAVAEKAVLREDGADVPVETRGCCPCSRASRKTGRRKEFRKKCFWEEHG